MEYLSTETSIRSISEPTPQVTGSAASSGNPFNLRNSIKVNNNLLMFQEPIYNSISDTEDHMTITQLHDKAQIKKELNVVARVWPRAPQGTKCRYLLTGTPG